MSARVTVLSVLKSGGVYAPEWVRRLRQQVERHLHARHEFVCLTDVPMEGVKTRPLLHDWPGYWSKMELYRPDIADGRCLYFDLDTLIVGDITPLAGYSGHFASLRDFYSPAIQASGVLAWDGADPPPLYKLARTDDPRMRRNARSDLWWNQHLQADVLQDLYPGLIGSYKADGLEAGPGGFRVICFHGEPKQTDLPGTWVDDAWRAAA